MLQKNILQFVVAATAIGAASAGGPPSETKDSSTMTVEGDADLGNCHDCGCFTCDAVTAMPDGSLDIQVGHCKDGEISWMCCVGVDGAEGNCDVMAPCEDAKCNGIGKGTGLLINVPEGSTYFSINTHDGQTAGDGDMNVNGICGGSGKNQGGGCGKDPFTAHCEIDFDIALDCGYSAPSGGSDPAPEPASDPAPEPASDPAPEPASDPAPEPEKVESEQKQKETDSTVKVSESEESAHFDINKTLYGAPIPDCGDPGQNESFQGRPLTNNKGECDKINICHGTAGGGQDAFKWNLITVSRSKNGGLPGHTGYNHNNYDGKGKLPDYYPSTTSVPNPNGAGKYYGSLDGACNFVPSPNDPDPMPVTAGASVVVCEEDEGEFTMEEIDAANLGRQAQPGDEVKIKGTTYFLTEECDLVTERTDPAPEPASDPAPEPASDPAPEPASDPAPEPASDPAPEPASDPAPEPASDPAPEPQPQPEPEPQPEPQVKAPPSPGPSKGSGSGDPHFKTWTGDKYDYHGECDLVLVDSPTFMDGLGLSIHIRTTRVKYFSYIEQVAVKIGEDVLEFNNDIENFYINGVVAEANQQHHKTHLAGFIVRRDAKALSIRLHDEGSVSRHNGSNAKIDLHTRKNGFPAVIVDGGNTDVFKNSLGLLGDWATGKRLARDGKTEMNGHDATDFALEWQVRDTEPSLFKDARFPQFPTTCTPPAKQLNNRLGLSSFEQEAEKACAHWQEDKEDCIFDVIATRDVLVADEGHIVHIA